jgi:hypothetical protein
LRKYSREDQRLLATWAADCAERVLGLFQTARAHDDRPRRAIEECRAWVLSGQFRMAAIRQASLSAHAAARETANKAAGLAAQAAGQAVATAHVPQHAFGAAYYALRAVAEACPTDAISRVAQERDWQLRDIAENLREQAANSVMVRATRNRVDIKLDKGKDF